jgi:hypothetical protein
MSEWAGSSRICVHKPFWRVSAACLIYGYPRQPALAGGRWWNPGTEGGTAMRRWITALTVLGTAGAGVVAAAPAAVAANPGCLVVDTNSNQSYPSSQAAVSAAAAGDTLFVKGTCTGLTVIPTSLASLTITGQSNGGTKTATLAGRLVIDSVTVTLNDLVFTNSPNAGGGIFARLATVTLNDSTVTNTKFGTGIENASGTVTLNDSTVTDNTAGQRSTPGGIENINGTLILNGNSSVAGNTGDTGGGIENGGAKATLIMNGSSTVTGNTVTGDGGGIFNVGGTVIMNDSSSITGNTNPNVFGGGIDNLAGTVTLNDSSSITGNVAGTPGIITGQGGGIYNDCGTLNGAIAPPAADANVFGNSPDNIADRPAC